MNELEEDIFIVESFLKNKKMLSKHPVWVSEKTLQAIENLINKNKELRQEVAEHERREAQQDQNMVSTLEEALKYCLEIKDLEEKNKELKKMVELMAEELKIILYNFESMSEEEIIGYFKKKASEENG